MDKNRKIRAMTLSLNPTIQSIFGENCDTNLALKDRKMDK